MRRPSVLLPISGWFVVTCLVSSAQAQEKGPGPIQGNKEGITYRLSVRTVEQIAAFYEGRGFPRRAIQALTKACFITVFLANRRQDVVWLELERWRFVDAQGKEVSRLSRPYWNALWKKLDVPLAHRATFGWTQLPERRDLRPQEPVGGNVTVVPPSGTFAFEARFHTGKRKEGKDIVLRFAGLTCPGRAAKGVSP